MEQKVLQVEGMSCNHCKMNIEKALQGIGVKVNVDLESKSVSIEYDPLKIKVEQIINEIEEQGYTVE
ncbi:MAG: copper resistance protein CopZ [Firmicutes bacterium HGW-Firmicutes-12]|jgi:copper chaperone|nr:MAG: copper resistance protein CopZ [Firmicutes bacterium HGW-Firmicutes-12]